MSACRRSAVCHSSGVSKRRVSPRRAVNLRPPSVSSSSVPSPSRSAVSVFSRHVTQSGGTSRAEEAAACAGASVSCTAAAGASVSCTEAAGASVSEGLPELPPHPDSRNTRAAAAIAAAVRPAGPAPAGPQFRIPSALIYCNRQIHPSSSPSGIAARSTHNSRHAGYPSAVSTRNR